MEYFRIFSAKPESFRMESFRRNLSEMYFLLNWNLSERNFSEWNHSEGIFKKNCKTGIFQKESFRKYFFIQPESFRKNLSEGIIPKESFRKNLSENNFLQNRNLSEWNLLEGIFRLGHKVVSERFLLKDSF
jgi:hypothetical protein